jgi:hypothetical protein
MTAIEYSSGQARISLSTSNGGGISYQLSNHGNWTRNSLPASQAGKPGIQPEFESLVTSWSQLLFLSRQISGFSMTDCARATKKAIRRKRAGRQANLFDSLGFSCFS